MSLAGQITLLATRIATEVKAKAPIASPSFSGVPLAPTAAAGTSTTQIATTAFVGAGLKHALADPGEAALPSTYPDGLSIISTAVNAWSLSTDALTVVTMRASDFRVAQNAYEKATGNAWVRTSGGTTSATWSAWSRSADFGDLNSYALLAGNPAFTNGASFTGTSPTAPTPTAGDNTTKIATTAFVAAGLALKANLASPTFSGTVALGTATATAPASTANDSTVPTTAWVRTYTTSTYANVSGDTFTGVVSGPTAAQGTNTTQLATTAFVTTSVALSGVPTAPTAAAGTNTTQIATTAYVRTALGSYVPLAGGTMTGQLQVRNSSTAISQLDGATLALTNGVGTLASLNTDGTNATLTGTGTLFLQADNQAATATDFTLSNDGNPRVSSQAVLNRGYTSAATGNSGTGGSSFSGRLVTITTAGTIGTLDGATTFQIPYAYANNLSGQRAMLINVNGTLGTASSSRRFKEDIEPLAWDDETIKRWLEVAPVSFRYKEGEHADGDRSIQHGFIAEDVHDAGFTQMVYYDGGDPELGGEPDRVDGFAYERMGVYDHLAIRRLLERIESLEQRLGTVAA